MPTGPVVATETVTGIRIVAAIMPYYQQARRQVGLGPQDPFRSTRTAHSKWSPAETAILMWHRVVGHRLLSRTGAAFRSQAAMLLEMSEIYNFQRTVTQWRRKYSRK